MSAYPSEPWQEGGNGFCNDGQFVRSGDGVFFPQQQQQELAYMSNSALQNGTGQFGVGRCGEGGCPKVGENSPPCFRAKGVEWNGSKDGVDKVYQTDSLECLTVVLS